jgi:uncharacterized protein
MGSKVKEILNTGKYQHPSYVKETIYEVITGSQAYGVSNENSDFDIYSVCIPPKYIVFPFTNGIIPYFGNQGEKFEQYQQQHIKHNNKDYDISVYNIVKYFQLCMENNPNMIDTLFVPLHCILHKTVIGDMIRDNRKLFLHKGCWHKFKGYAYSQLHKCLTKNPEGKRVEIVNKYGFDVKFASHVIRLVDECEQILLNGDIDLLKSKEHQKAIRKGEVSLDDIQKWFQEKEKHLENLYNTSKIQYKPDEEKLKVLLLDCLEMQYGKLTNVFEHDINIQSELQKITDAVNIIQTKIK